jgi:hypothetical protein
VNSVSRSESQGMSDEDAISHFVHKFTSPVSCFILKLFVTHNRLKVWRIVTDRMHKKKLFLLQDALRYAILKLQIDKTTFHFVCLLQRSGFFMVFRCHMINEIVTDRYIYVVTERDSVNVSKLQVNYSSD